MTTKYTQKQKNKNWIADTGWLKKVNRRATKKNSFKVLEIVQLVLH